jgi:hypothetical protein
LVNAAATTNNNVGLFSIFSSHRKVLTGCVGF